MKTLFPQPPAPDAKSFAEEKACLRGVMQARREALSETERVAASLAICRRLLELPLLAARRSDSRGVVAVYLATPDEANVDEAVAVLLAHGLSLAAPVLAPNSSGPAFGRLSSLSAVRRGLFGIRSPLALAASASSPRSGARDAVEVEDISVMLVPGLAFDCSGARLGRGGGWYDRVLSRANRQNLKGQNLPAIGVCFECQLVPQVPCEPHDERVSVIVTEAQTIEMDGH